jgi:hypothetical protein
MVLLGMGVELNEGDQTTKALSDAIAWASSERILPKFASVLHFRTITRSPFNRSAITQAFSP